ncbi:MAG: phage terminase small subunit P27 family [Dehalococcoidia bacterium]
MTARGRKPTPTALKLVRGNPGRRPLNQDEPTPRVRVPAAPRHLSDEAKREWHRVGRQLADAGLVTALDRAALAAYCQAWGRWVEAEELLKRHGMLVKSPNGYPMMSPYLNVANRAMEQMRLLLTEFGMSPSSRSRVSVVKAEAESAFERRFVRGHW